MKIAIVANTGWYLFNFRLNLARSLAALGHEVVAIGDNDAYGARIAAAGIAYRAAPFTGAGTRLCAEWACVRTLRALLREEAVDIVLSYTPKGNIYAALALWNRCARQVANVSGLGRAFVDSTPLTRLVRLLYRFSFRRAAWVFFQNEDDRRLFVSSGLVDVARTSRVPGSGVDLHRFVPSALPTRAPERANFLFVGRLIHAKGICEYVEAARRVRTERPHCRFRVLGAIGSASADAIDAATLNAWQADGLIEHLGTTDDVRTALSDADCVVLPSYYREGVPRSLLEAAACARPLLASNAVGCRDAVDDGLSGYLCRPRDAEDLARQMLRFIALPVGEREVMGRRGRHKMEREFDEALVIEAYLALMTRLAGG
jgi:glycosyltransferase involved in cell wall biosynthesis